MGEKAHPNETPVDEQTDEQALVNRAKQGDREALEALLQAKLVPVLRFGRSLCGDEDDAQEIAQETLLTAYRQLEQFRGDSSLSSWLYVVARSACRRHRRRRAGEPAAFDELDHDDMDTENPTPEALAEQAQARERVRDAIETLSPKAREVILLHDLQGLTAQQIASRLDLGIPAVKSRIHRARAALAQELGIRNDIEID